MLYHAEPDPAFSEAELGILQNLKQNRLKLRLHVQVKPPGPAFPDSPDMGIQPPRHSGMGGHIGTAALIWTLDSLEKSVSTVGYGCQGQPNLLLNLLILGNGLTNYNESKTDDVSTT